MLTVTDPATGVVLITSPADKPWPPALRILLDLWLAALIGWPRGSADSQDSPTEALRDHHASFAATRRGSHARRMCHRGVPSGGRTPSTSVPVTIAAASGTLTQATQVTLTITQ